MLCPRIDGLLESSSSGMKSTSSSIANSGPDWRGDRIGLASRGDPDFNLCSGRTIRSAREKLPSIRALGRPTRMISP